MLIASYVIIGALCGSSAAFGVLYCFESILQNKASKKQIQYTDTTDSQPQADDADTVFADLKGDAELEAVSMQQSETPQAEQNIASEIDTQQEVQDQPQAETIVASQDVQQAEQQVDQPQVAAVVAEDTETQQVQQPQAETVVASQDVQQTEQQVDRPQVAAVVAEDTENQQVQQPQAETVVAPVPQNSKQAKKQLRKEQIEHIKELRRLDKARRRQKGKNIQQTQTAETATQASTPVYVHEGYAPQGVSADPSIQSAPYAQNAYSAQAYHQSVPYQATAVSNVPLYINPDLLELANQSDNEIVMQEDFFVESIKFERQPTQQQEQYAYYQQDAAATVANSQQYYQQQYYQQPLEQEQADSTADVEDESPRFDADQALHQLETIQQAQQAEMTETPQQFESTQDHQAEDIENQHVEMSQTEDVDQIDQVQPVEDTVVEQDIYQNQQQFEDEYQQNQQFENQMQTDEQYTQVAVEQLAADAKQSSAFAEDGLLDLVAPHFDDTTEQNLEQALTTEQASRDFLYTNDRRYENDEEQGFEQINGGGHGVQTIATYQLRQLVDEAKRAKSFDEAELHLTFSRVDVLDYFADSEKLQNYPLAPTLKPKSKNCLFDRMFCGDRCFGLAIERGNVVKLVLQLDDGFADWQKSQHKLLREVKPADRGNWYSVIVDLSFQSKEQVFEFVENSYGFVLANYFVLDEQQVFHSDVELTLQNNNEIEEFASSHALEPDSDFIFAIAQREIALEKYKFANQPAFEFDIDKLVSFVGRSKNFADDTEVVEREKPTQPTILKTNSKPFALIYVKKPFAGHSHPNVFIKARLSEVFANKLCQMHPRISKIRYSGTRNWHLIPIDGSFASMQEVYQLLINAKAYVQQINSK